jgi:hypothetical protein
MTHPKNSYIRCGLGLLTCGILCALVASLILDITWFTAFGLSLVIIGVIMLALGYSTPGLSPELSRILFETGSENISDMLEELCLTNRAVYLPPSMTGGNPRALIPLTEVELLSLPLHLPARRLITKYGSSPENTGLLVTTPGTAVLRALEPPLEASPAVFESTLTAVFRGMLDIADSITVSLKENSLTVRIRGLRYEPDHSWGERSLGSLPASMAAAIAAATWDTPVKIISEKTESKLYHIELQLMTCAYSIPIF